MLKNFIRKLPVALYAALLFFCMAMLVIFPERYVAAAFDGIKIWATTVLPSLLPFFFLTALLSKTEVLPALFGGAGKITRILYRQSGIAAYAQAMSFLSGYPVGAKIVADLYKGGAIDEAQATKISVVSSTSGPLFIVGGIGLGMFSSSKVGYIILIAHYLSSIFCGIVFRFLPSGDGGARPIIKKCDDVLYESAYSTVVSVAIVGAFISIFYVFANILADTKLLYPLQFVFSKIFGQEISDGFTIGLIECTTGIRAIARSGATALSVALSCTLITLGGASVWCQSLVYLSRAKIRTGIFVLSKIIQAIAAFSFCYLLFYLL